MSKNIIFCADGTWDTAQNKTNVYKLFKSFLITSDQIAFYDDGVGSDGTPLDRLNGGAFGDGLFHKIKDGYTKIAHVYEQDDNVFIFGFSRGAYTARCLAGMMAVCGLPTANFNDDLVGTAFRAYRDKTRRAALLAAMAPYNLFKAKLTMVGVWDTVGALGIPALFGQVDPLLYGFLDTGLHPDVLNAYQALSVDERRQEFPPTLWSSPAAPVPGQTLEQVWFSGVHCDVGGGYPETGLADITLSWMMGKAKALGLEIDPEVLAKYATLDAKHALDKIHESWNPLWLFPRPRTIAANATLSNSVAIRCESDNSYRPKNLMLNKDILANGYQSVQVVTPPQ